MTGASRGIGERFARQLAETGTDLVLVARDAERLEQVAKDIRDQHGVQVEVLAADLTDAAGLGRVEARLHDGVDLLVNNAGAATMGGFLALPVERAVASVDLNVTPLVRLTHAALGAMVAAGRGAVINVSSIAGLQPTSGLSAYAGTKAFVNSFSEAVHEEVRGTGVTVTTVLPGFIRTDMSAAMTELNALPSFLWLTPDVVAAAGLRAARRGRPVVVPSLRFKAIVVWLALLPRSVKRRASGAGTRRRMRSARPA
ncbi:hypothetical protein EV193_1018 [Herbihabitans rhizosphaerae]|uniref:Short-subunit dehydrogenase n=1 Tax=Herbihabitans rhizosphaerae TaxID=1872711 RepID=A0A4Q7L4I5_9PSEU|nr:hypothetical protein EV193_1018 [Herbihabitans rhizosphaerae]